jgi:hypothetical protein
LPSYIDTEEDRWYDKGHGQDSLNLPLEAQQALGAISIHGSKYVTDPRLAFFGTARELDYGDKTYMAQVNERPRKLDVDFYVRSGENVVPPESVDFTDPDEAEAQNFAELKRT